MKCFSRLKVNTQHKNITSIAAKASVLPAIAVGFTFFAYGTQTSSAGLSILEHILTTSIIYAIPGMLVLVDQVEMQGQLITVVLGVFFVNMRLMPMTMAITPMVRSATRWKNILGLHFVAMTTWLFYFRFHQQLPAHQRMNFYLLLGSFIWVVSNIFGILGYFAAVYVGKSLLAVFVFANPLYFMCLLLDQFGKVNFLSVLFAGITFPLFYYFFGEWAVLLCGLVCGSFVYGINFWRWRSKAS